MKRKRLFFIAVLVFVMTIVINTVPYLTVKAENNDEPKLVAKAAVSIDLKTGEIIYGKNIDEKKYPASMTKLMTAILFAENKSKSDDIKYTETAKAQPQYSLSTDIMTSIKVGDTMPAEDVMKALLLFSANDSAYMIADAVAGNSEAFMKMMNDKAAELNMKNTHFISPNGLHDPNHYSTAYDMALLGRAAYLNPWVKETIALKKERISTSSGLIAYVENRNKLLGQNGNMGGKTGYTSQAGKCLVSIYERDGRTLVGVVMQSEFDYNDTQVFKDMEELINYSFNKQRTTVYSKGTVLKTEKVTYKPLKFFGPEKVAEIPIVVNDEVSYYDNDINKKELKTEISLSEINVSKLSSDTKIGTLTVKQREYSQSYDLYAGITSKELKSSNKLLYAAAIGGLIVILLAVLVIILLIRKAIRRRNRRKYRYW